MILRQIFILIALILPIEVFGEQISGKQIRQEVENWLEKNNIEPNFSILPEKKYPLCKEIEISKISVNFNLLKISCFTPNKWSFILRNKVLPTKKHKKEVKIIKNNKRPKYKILVLNKKLESGSIIRTDDLKIVEKRTKNDNMVSNHDYLIGKKLKKSMLPNKPIYFSSLEKNWMIEKDSKVMIENNIGPISVKVAGIALENGDIEQKIKVMNASSGEILSGFVKNNKKVQINAKQF